QYHRRKTDIPKLFPDCDFFDTTGLRVLPMDLIDAMFRAKLLFACQEKECFYQRSGEGSGAISIWHHKPATFNDALELYFEWIKNLVKERTLLTQLSSFIGPRKGKNQDNGAVQTFFEQLF